MQTALAALAALLLQQRFRRRHIARTWIIASWVIPTIVTAFLWRWMLNADFGVINHLLRAVHVLDRPIDFLGSPSYAFATVTWINAAMVSLYDVADPCRTHSNRAGVL